MIYTPLLLNGTWEMQYSDEEYLSIKDPFAEFGENTDIAGTEPDAMHSSVIENAVPGYWEDMTGAFGCAPFFNKLRINPEYGIQQYPVAGIVPDMALPNIVGNFCYRRSFELETVPDNVSLHFEGVQNTVSVWINSEFIGKHCGYSTPFEFRIPDGVLKKGNNMISLSVSNFRLKGYDDEPVSGLTSRAANECTGGITGDVELRMYNCGLRDAVVMISDDCKRADVVVSGEIKSGAEWRVEDSGEVIKSGSANGNFSFDTEGLAMWSPESPKLYTLVLNCDGCVFETQFGVRRLLADKTHFSLNGKPYFLRGVCEHCYFPETIHPAHDFVYYKSIIKNLKKLGFNFIRFHTYIPEEEYMQAADELGMLLHVESPNNTSLDEWKEIVRFCRRHTSVVIYCCGNELLMDDPFIDHLHKCADAVHQNTDSLFSPMSAMRGLEYYWNEPDQQGQTKEEPFKHHPRRFETVGSFSDLYSSYTNGHHSYLSVSGDAKTIDEWNVVYNKPRVSHEICIDGTYTDLSLKDRYKGLRVGKTDMFTSIERHLESKGVLKNAPLYFKNSCEWQRRVRKYCFETLRLSEHMAGYDFLGPIDTHWHTFGYDVGMMNEFYEMKPGESVRNVLMYNSETVILTNLGRRTNFECGETLSCDIFTSYYGDKCLDNAELTIRLFADGKIIDRRSVDVGAIQNGTVSEIYTYSTSLPCVSSPAEMKLCVTLEGEGLYAENEWELYLFPKASAEPDNLVVLTDTTESELTQLLADGKNVLLLGSKPFPSLGLSFQNALPGRSSGNLATVIYDHPSLASIPHDGFCGWQFNSLMEGGNAVCFEAEGVPFNPVIEVVSTHKYVIRQAALFEFGALNGKLMVCSFNFDDKDPAANWLRAKLIEYASGEEFEPTDFLDENAFAKFINTSFRKAAANSNFAFNANDKTSTRRKK